jgi:hypothetical protein
MWKGSIVGLQKSNHPNWLSHEIDNGGSITVGPVVKVDIDPITEQPLDEDESWVVVKFTLASGDSYYYLVPEGSEEFEDSIAKTIEDYTKNPVDDGRVLWDYLVEPDPDDPTNKKIRDFIGKDLQDTLGNGPIIGFK